MSGRVWFVPAKDGAIFIHRADGMAAIDEDGAHEGIEITEYLTVNPPASTTDHEQQETT